MNAKGKSLLSAGVVLCAAGSLVAGNAWRDRIDRGLGIDSHKPLSFGTLLASKQGDFDVAEGDYFRELTILLQDKFYEPVTDEQKLADGAVRGMIVSLNDPNSQYMDQAEFLAFTRARAGNYEGIGADFRYDLSNAETDASLLPESATNHRTLRIPRLVVALVVPGGPADRAGVQPGDWVNSIDGRWVVNSEPIEAFRAAQAKMGNGTPSPELLKMARELKILTDHALMPAKARDTLFLGVGSTLKVSWHRGKESRETTISTAPSQLHFGKNADGSLSLAFGPDAARTLKAAADSEKAITIDLRNNVRGDFESVRSCLAAVAPAGSYGYLSDERVHTGAQHSKTAPEFTVSDGNNSAPSLTLVVDRSTGGAAEIFAEALAAKGLAKIQGGPMSGDRSAVEVFELPGGAGYTLQTGTYSAKPPATKSAHRARPKYRIVAESGPTEDLIS